MSVTARTLATIAMIQIVVIMGTRKQIALNTFATTRTTVTTAISLTSTLRRRGSGMKRLRTIVKIIGAVLMGACVGTGLANFMKGDQGIVNLIAVMSSLNFATVLIIVVLEEDIDPQERLKNCPFEDATDNNVGRWIPCSERLPKVGEDVLFSVADMFAAEGCLRDDGNWWQFRWETVQLKKHVVAWMPLPEPWKEESDG